MDLIDLNNISDIVSPLDTKRSNNSTGEYPEPSKAMNRVFKKVETKYGILRD